MQIVWTPALKEPMLASPIKFSIEKTPEEQLAADLKVLRQLQYPVLATPKFDGFRATRIDEPARKRLVSRKWLDIRNSYIQEVVPELCPAGFDGELMVRHAAGLEECEWCEFPSNTFCSFQGCSSGVTSGDGYPDFRYMVFDWVRDDLKEEYEERVAKLRNWFRSVGDENSVDKFIGFVDFKKITSAEELLAYELEELSHGYEGLIIRRPNSPYKCGRSTPKEHYMDKVVRKLRDEGTVVGFVEQKANKNEAGKNAFGKMKRSTSKAGKEGKDTLGSFLLDYKGQQLKCGTGQGMTATMRQKIWENQKDYMGATVTFEYRPIGVKDLPRFPIWVGFRDESDR